MNITQENLGIPGKSVNISHMILSHQGPRGATGKGVNASRMNVVQKDLSSTVDNRISGMKIVHEDPSSGVAQRIMTSGINIFLEDSTATGKRVKIDRLNVFRDVQSPTLDSGITFSGMTNIHEGPSTSIGKGIIFSGINMFLEDSNTATGEDSRFGCLNIVREKPNAATGRGVEFSGMNFVHEDPTTALDKGVLAALASMKAHNLSLREFLLAAFRSNNSEIRRTVGMFYGKDGPSAILRCWNEVLWKSKDRHESLSFAAADVVLKRSNTELGRLKSETHLRHPSRAINRGIISAFSMEFFESRLDIAGPCLARVLNGLTHGSTSLRTTIGSMLLFNESQQSNYLQMMMGLYLYSLGCPKRVINLFNDARLSVSHGTICSALKALTKDALEEVRSAVQKQHWFLIYDNINFPGTKFHQRMGHTDTFESGATATIVLGEDLGKESPVQDQQPSLRDVLDTNRRHLRSVHCFHISDVLRRHQDDLKDCTVGSPVLRPLSVRKSVTFPLPAMKFDQGTTRGNHQIIENIMKDTLELPETWFDKERRIIVGGDMLTVTRIRSLKAFLTPDITPYRRMEWAIPVMQLFHLQMTFSSLILRIHYGSVSAPGSLAFNISKLGRKRLKPDSPCYYTADEFLRNVFDAMVRRLWEVELGCEGMDAIRNVVLSGLWEYSPRDSVALLSETIRKKYNTNSNDLLRNFTNASVNAALFVRDMVFYLELCDAIKQGDIGRIEEVLKVITIMFQAARTKNYANELLRLNYGIHHIWSEQRKNAIFSSWLINVKGRKDSWLPADLHQEHNNLLTKTIHSAKGSNMSWETLANSISTNVRLFSEIASKVESQYEVPFNGSSHSIMSAETDIQGVLQSLRDYGILGKDPHPQCPNVPLVVDLLNEGVKNLTEGRRFEKFVENMNHDLDHDAVVEGLEQEQIEAENFILEHLIMSEEEKKE